MNNIYAIQHKSHSHKTRRHKYFQVYVSCVLDVITFEVPLSLGTSGLSRYLLHVHCYGDNYSLGHQSATLRFLC